MQCCSDNVGALAAALAKAQSEIAKPEKSLTATIVSPFPREGGKPFAMRRSRPGSIWCASASASMRSQPSQTTAIDREGGLIRLTTTLVHASGEWVSSDWPVCPITETAAPHRLWRRPHLRTPLRPVHAGRDCWRRRSRCTGPGWY